MGIIAIDTETQSLNTHKFIMGCVVNEKHKVESFMSKKSMWEHIQTLIEQHARRNKTLLIYAHNMHYDFLTIKPDTLPKNYEIYCNNPFIVDVREGNRIVAKFLSTTSLFRGPLAKMGETLGYHKSETPEWLKKQEHEPTWEELNEARTYMERDALIVMRFVQQLKLFLRSKGIGTRWLITSGQIGINYLMQRLRVADNNKAFFSDLWAGGQLYKTNYSEYIHSALRGGHVEAFTFGHKNNVSAIDINSHYPHCLATMRVPDLRTEQYIDSPLDTMDLLTLLGKVGVSSVQCIVPDIDYGILPVRTDGTNTYYPCKKGQRIIGIYTHRELSYALERGYIIEKVHSSIVWDDTENPFQFMFDLAQERLDADTDLQKHFLKMLMNSAIGKLAQRRPDMALEWVEMGVRREEELLEEGYQAVEQDGYYRLYSKKGNYNYPRFYCPIINALVTAEGRIRLHEIMEQFPKGTLHYVDTDGLVVDNDVLKTTNFKYSNFLGDFKLEHEDQSCLIYGRKSLMIGEEVRLSGVPKAFITIENFQKGKIAYKRMRTTGNTHDSSLVGTFTDYDRDLTQSLTDARTLRNELNEQMVFMDHSLTENLRWKAHKEYTQEQPS